MLIDTTLLDALPDAFLLVQDGIIRWASSGASKLLGAAPGALEGRPFADVLAPGEAERLGTFEHQRSTGWELPATGRVRFVRVSDGALVDTDVQTGAPPPPGEPASTTLYCARNVADVQRAEELLGKLADLGRDPRAMLGADALLDAAEPIFLALEWTGALTEILDDGSITRRVIAPVNHPVGDYARTLLDRKTPFDKTPILAEVVRTAEAVFLPNVPTLLSGPPRTAVPLGESMTRARLTRSAWCPVVRDGRVTHLFAVAGRDLTEHDMVALRMFAAQIGAANRMLDLHAALLQRERLAAIGEMAAVIAHEVRNPLAVIFNALNGLRRPGRAPGDEEQLLAVAWEEAERMKRLVSDLLEFAHPNKPMVESVALAPLVQEAIAAVRRDPGVPHANLAELEVSIPEAIPTVEADPLRLYRALVNLLTNAFQHVPATGTVRIAAERAGEGEVRISVYNDGVPIADANVRRIFDPFFTTQATGTGLGLAVVRRVVEEVGGRIGLDATGTGVSFSLWLRSEPREAERRSRNGITPG